MTTTDQRNLFEDLHDQALAEAEADRGTTLALSALDLWHVKADRFVGSRVGSKLTADDLTAAVGLPTREDGAPSNNGIGGYFAGLVGRGVARHVGWVPSTRVTSHGRYIRQWQIVRMP